MAKAKIIQLVRGAGWGDIIMSTAVFPGLKQKGYRIRYITLPEFRSAVEGHPLVDEVVAVGLPRLGNMVRDMQRNFHIWTHTQGMEKAVRTVHFTHPPYFSLIRNTLQKWDASLDQHFPVEHTISHFCKQAQVPINDELTIPLTDEQRLWGEQFKDTVLIQMFSSNVQKDWPMERWRQFVELLKREFNVQVIQIGSLKHPTLDNVPKMNNPGINHAMAAIQHCRLFIGGDSAFNHVCRALKKPGLILWGNTHPYRFGYGQNVNLWNGKVYTPQLGRHASPELSPGRKPYFPTPIAPGALVNPQGEETLRYEDKYLTTHEKDFHPYMLNNSVDLVFEHARGLLHQVQ